MDLVRYSKIDTIFLESSGRLELATTQQILLQYCSWQSLNLHKRCAGLLLNLFHRGQPFKHVDRIQLV